jgi:hypothetical protein
MAALFFVGEASAAAVTDLAKASFDAVKIGDNASNLAFLERARKVAPDEEVVVKAVDLARLFLYAGLARYKQGDTDDDSVEFFRRALAIDSELVWKEEDFNNDDAWTLFEALRRELSGKKKITAGVPEYTGQAEIYIDGNRVLTGEDVYLGRHLVQIVCPGGQVYGRWQKFGKPPKYRSMCPDGFGKVAALDDSAASDEVDALQLFDEFGNPISSEKAAASPSEPEVEFDMFGNPISADAAPAVAAAPVAEVEAPAAEVEAPAAEVEAVAAAPERKPAEEAAPAEEPVAVVVGSSSGVGGGLSLSSTGMMVSGGGAVCIVAGAVVNFAIVNPLYNTIEYYRENPEEISRDDANSLTAMFNSASTATMALVGIGLAGAVGGVFIDGASFGISPNGLWLSADF